MFPVSSTGTKSLYYNWRTTYTHWFQLGIFFVTLTRKNVEQTVWILGSLKYCFIMLIKCSKSLNSSSPFFSFVTPRPRENRSAKQKPTPTATRSIRKRLFTLFTIYTRQLSSFCHGNLVTHSTQLNTRYRAKNPACLKAGTGPNLQSALFSLQPMVSLHLELTLAQTAERMNYYTLRCSEQRRYTKS